MRISPPRRRAAFYPGTGSNLAWVWLCLLLLALVMPGLGQAQPQTQAGSAAVPAAVLLTAKDVLVDADHASAAWLDPTGQVGIDQVGKLADNAFTASNAQTIYKLGDSGSVWLRYRVSLSADATDAWLLAVPMPLLDSAKVYLRLANGQWQAQLGGDAVAVNRWAVPGRYPVFHLRLTPGKTQDVYLQVNHRLPVNLVTHFVTDAAHDRAMQRDFLVLGALFGGMVLLIGVCLVQAALYRDASYGLYAAYLSFTMLAVAGYTGIASLMLWPNATTWSDMAKGFFGLLAGGAAALFVRTICNINDSKALVSKALLIAGIVAPPCAVAYLLVDRALGVNILGMYFAAVCILAPLVGVMTWRRGDGVGLWVAGGYIPLALTIVLVLLQARGLAPSNWLTQHGYVGALFVQIICLLIALNLRTRARHGSQSREEALASQDALTGLLATHLFNDRLRQMIARAKRAKEHAAVVVVELVNYKAIRAQHGATTAEQSVLRSVIKLRRVMRDTDTVSRIDDARFGLILEGVSDRAKVTELAAQLIASGLMPLKGLRPDVRLQFHAAGVLLNERIMPAYDMLQALTERLDVMSPRTRRPIRFLEPEVTQPMQLSADGASGPDSLNSRYEDHDHDLDDAGHTLPPPVR